MVRDTSNQTDSLPTRWHRVPGVSGAVSHIHHLWFEYKRWNLSRNPQAPIPQDLPLSPDQCSPTWIPSQDGQVAQRRFTALPPIQTLPSGLRILPFKRLLGLGTGLGRRVDEHPCVGLDITDSGAHSFTCLHTDSRQFRSKTSALWLLWLAGVSQKPTATQMPGPMLLLAVSSAVTLPSPLESIIPPYHFDTRFAVSGFQVWNLELFVGHLGRPWLRHLLNRS